MNPCFDIYLPQKTILLKVKKKVSVKKSLNRRKLIKGI